jgi:hypothetical protein
MTTDSSMANLTIIALEVSYWTMGWFIVYFMTKALAKMPVKIKAIESRFERHRSQERYFNNLNSFIHSVILLIFSFYSLITYSWEKNKAFSDLELTVLKVRDSNISARLATSFMIHLLVFIKV